jgi:hypothetical protein
MPDIQRAYFNGHRGWLSAKTGRVRFGDKIFPSIIEAVKYLSHK